MSFELPYEINDSTDRGKEGDGTVPDGEYLVKVENFEADEKGDKKFIKSVYLILDAAREANEGAIGLHIYDIFSLTKEAAWKLAKFADACNPPKFSGKKLDAEGKVLRVRTRTGEWNGRERVECIGYKPPQKWKGVRITTDSEGKMATVDSDGEVGL